MLPSRKKPGELIAIHLTAIAILTLVFLFYECPILYFFHIPCPGCGIVRAHRAAMALDFKSAFSYHPLFFTVAPMLLYPPHKNLLKKRLSDKAETIIFFTITAVFIIIYILRLLSPYTAMIRESVI